MVGVLNEDYIVNIVDVLVYWFFFFKFVKLLSLVFINIFYISGIIGNVKMVEYL